MIEIGFLRSGHTVASIVGFDMNKAVYVDNVVETEAERNSRAKGSAKFDLPIEPGAAFQQIRENGPNYQLKLAEIEGLLAGKISFVGYSQPYRFKGEPLSAFWHWYLDGPEIKQEVIVVDADTTLLHKPVAREIYGEANVERVLGDDFFVSSSSPDAILQQELIRAKKFLRNLGIAADEEEFGVRSGKVVGRSTFSEADWAEYKRKWQVIPIEKISSHGNWPNAQYACAVIAGINRVKYLQSDEVIESLIQGLGEKALPKGLSEILKGETDGLKKIRNLVVMERTGLRQFQQVEWLALGKAIAAFEAVSVEVAHLGKSVSDLANVGALVQVKKVKGGKTRGEHRTEEGAGNQANVLKEALKILAVRPTLSTAQLVSDIYLKLEPTAKKLAHSTVTSHVKALVRDGKLPAKRRKKLV